MKSTHDIALAGTVAILMLTIFSVKATDAGVIVNSTQIVSWTLDADVTGTDGTVTAGTTITFANSSFTDLAGSVDNTPWWQGYGGSQGDLAYKLHIAFRDAINSAYPTSLPYQPDNIVGVRGSDHYHFVDRTYSSDTRYTFGGVQIDTQDTKATEATGNWAVDGTPNSAFASEADEVYFAVLTTGGGDVPEPSTAIAMGLLGVVGFAGNRRRRRQVSAA